MGSDSNSGGGRGGDPRKQDGWNDPKNPASGGGKNPNTDTKTQVDSFKPFSKPDKPKGFDASRGPSVPSTSKTLSAGTDSGNGKYGSIPSNLTITPPNLKGALDKNISITTQDINRARAAKNAAAASKVGELGSRPSLDYDYDPSDDDYDETYTLSDVTREQEDPTSYYNLSQLEGAQKDSEDFGSKVASFFGIGSELEYTPGAGWEEGTQFSAASIANSWGGGALLSAAFGILPTLIVAKGLQKIEDQNKPEVYDYTHDYNSFESRMKSFTQHLFGPNAEYDPHGASGLPDGTFGDNNSTGADFQKEQQIAKPVIPTTGNNPSAPETNTPTPAPLKTTSSNGSVDDDLYSLYRRMLGGYFRNV